MVDGQTKHYAYYTNTITISIKKYTAKYTPNKSQLKCLFILKHNSYKIKPCS